MNANALNTYTLTPEKTEQDLIAHINCANRSVCNYKIKIAMVYITPLIGAVTFVALLVFKAYALAGTSVLVTIVAALVFAFSSDKEYEDIRCFVHAMETTAKLSANCLLVANSLDKNVVLKYTINNLD